jgi:L-rhamnose-H+ transport protein
MSELTAGFGWIFFAAVCGGVFGLQYRVMRKYTVENSALLTMFFATIVVPLVAVWFILPGWTDAIREVGWRRNLLVFILGFGWGMGAITYAYGYNILGMALAASVLQGINLAVGAGVPLVRHWNEVSLAAKGTTIVGLVLLLFGAALAGKAGRMREREQSAAAEEPSPKPNMSSVVVHRATGIVFLLGIGSCVISGLLSACANLGYEFADPLERAMGADLAWRATLIRWLPMYWGGITALVLVLGGTMLKRGTWRNYFLPGTGRDCLISVSMGLVHFLAQIPYGIGAYCLGALGTSVGWGANIGMALLVAVSLGFVQGEWKGVSRSAVGTLRWGIAVLLVAIAVLACANSQG